MLRNPDGSQYKTVGSRQQFDPENPIHCLFNLWDAEALRIGGSPIFYYETFISKAVIDPLYKEARGKLYSNHPIQLYGYYEPVPSQNYQNSFGFDSPEEVIFKFNYRDVLQTIGHPPKVGSRLHTPHKRENWKIIQRNSGDFQMWGEIRLELICQKWQGSITTPDNTNQQAEPDFKIN